MNPEGQDVTNSNNPSENPLPSSEGAVHRTRPDKSTGAIPKVKLPSQNKNIDMVISVGQRQAASEDLRACLVCSMVKPTRKLLKYGCENCEEFLKMKNNQDNINMCTTALFDGVIYLKDPAWVVKWPRNIARVPGLYALCLYVKSPNGTIREMRAHTCPTAANPDATHN